MLGRSRPSYSRARVTVPAAAPCASLRAVTTLHGRFSRSWCTAETLGPCTPRNSRRASMIASPAVRPTTWTRCGPRGFCASITATQRAGITSPVRSLGRAEQWITSIIRGRCIGIARLICCVRFKHLFRGRPPNPQICDSANQPQQIARPRWGWIRSVPRVEYFRSHVRRHGHKHPARTSPSPGP